jgi:hypothetical protein
MNSPPLEIFLCIIQFIDHLDTKTFKRLWAVCHNSKRACEFVSAQVRQQYDNTEMYVWRQIYDMGRRSPGPPDYDARWRVSSERPDDLEIDPRGKKPLLFLAKRHELLDLKKKIFSK